MSFLYDEITSRERAALTAHLAACPECHARVSQWRESATALDAWTLPRRSRPRIAAGTAVRWALAAAVVLCATFAWGRSASSQAKEIAALRSEVARLSTELPHRHAEDLQRMARLATAAASAETVKVLSEFAEATGEQRDTDRQALADALKRLDARFEVLRGQIETVAINTETTFAQTRQNLSQLAALSLPAEDGTPLPAGRD